VPVVVIRASPTRSAEDPAIIVGLERAPAELLANAEKLKEMLSALPAGWQSKNLEVVIQIREVSYAPLAMKVVATSVW
jgi:hypothetical protein